jgi:hypothetical protein
VADAANLAGLSRFLSQASWDEHEVAKQWLADVRKAMEPQVKTEQARLRQTQPNRGGCPRIPFVTGDDSRMHQPKGQKMQGLGYHHL